MSHDPPAHGFVRELARFGAVFAVLLTLHAPALTLPHHWDALNRIHNAHTIAAHGFSPFLPAGVTFLDAQGRPPLLLQLLALTVLLGPYDLMAAHLLWLAFAALAVYMTERLGRRAWTPMVGAVAAVWLAINPLFFAQSEIIVMDLPVTALTLGAAVCLVERRRGLYLVTATILVLAKEAAQLALPGFVLFAWLAAPAGKRWRDSALAAVPFLAFLAWIVACKLRYAWFLDPYMSSFLRVAESGAAWRGLLLSLLYFATLMLQLGFWDGNWGLTLLVLATLVARTPARATRLRVVLAAMLALGIYALYPEALALVHERLARLAGVVTTGALLQDTYAQLRRLRAILTVTAGLTVFALPALRRVDWRAPRLWLVLGVAAGYVGLFTVIKFRMVRYLLPVYPFVFLVAAAALERAGAAWRRMAIAVVITLLFVSSQWGERSGPGNILESNLEFRDMIAVRRAAAAYLEGIAPVRVLASWPETMELRFPYEGYVSQSLTVIEHPRLGADVVYVSPQSRDPDLAATLRRAVPGVRLDPLLRVEQRGKSVELLRIVLPPR